ncbi:MAG TPA: PAS domain S-box protein [Malonomonas sp.]
MYAKIPVFKGVIVDQRNAIIALCGAFCGPLPAVLSATMAGVFRLSLGGEGVFAGVVGVNLAALAGVLLNRCPDHFATLRNAALSALFATIIILPGFLFVEDLQTGFQLMQTMALPYGAAIFLGIFLVGLLLKRQEDLYRFEISFRESEKRYRELVEGTEDLITVTDEQGCFTFVNHVAETILGLPAKECLGLSAFQFVHPEDRAMTADWFKKCLSAKVQHAKIENRQINATTGQVYSVFWSSVFHFDENGNFSGVGGIGRDISLRKQAEEERLQIEEQLRHSQKMEAIGTLSGGIAHDFNNILATILGYSELAERTIPEDNPAKKRIREVIKAGNRAKHLIMQILAFSRKTESNREPVLVRSVIEETVDFLRATLPSSIKIETRVSPDCGALLADQTQLQQVMMNLCTNSFHAMEATGGTLIIQAEVAPLTEDEKGNGIEQIPGPVIRISVKDSGVGIDPAHLERIFEPYFTTKATGKGIGIGLAVVHGIVKNHNGAVRVESWPDKGTKVSLYFPQVAAGENKVSEKAGLPPRGKEKILIVDDELTVAEVTRARLETLGYQGTIRTSSREALELFRAAPEAYDLVITDLTMPEMTGGQLAKELLAIRADLPIIMCTGFSTNIDDDKFRSIGIRTLLLKPVDNKELAHAVRSALDTPV